MNGCNYRNAAFPTSQRVALIQELHKTVIEVAVISDMGKRSPLHANVVLHYETLVALRAMTGHGMETFPYVEVREA